MSAPTSARLAYSIAGVECTISGDRDLLHPIELTYAAFDAADGEAASAYELSLVRRDGEALVSDSDGFRRTCAAEVAPIVGLDRIVQRVTAELARRGVYAIHAASLSAGGRGLLVSGRSGTGKSTLALGLVARGLCLLSDEFGVCAADGRTILPYRRAVHVRPGTPELIAELAFLGERPRHALGGGSEWSLLPAELAQVFPGCVGEACELGYVLLLGARHDAESSVVEPISGALAAVELTRATPAAADDFQAVLARMSALTERARCGRLDPGVLSGALEAVLEWIGEDAPCERADVA